MDEYRTSDERYAEAEKRARNANRKAEQILRHNETATTDEMKIIMDEVTTFAELEDDVQEKRARRLGFLGLFGRRAE